MPYIYLYLYFYAEKSWLTVFQWGSFPLKMKFNRKQNVLQEHVSCDRFFDGNSLNESFWFSGHDVKTFVSGSSFQFIGLLKHNILVL